MRIGKRLGIGLPKQLARRESLVGWHAQEVLSNHPEAGELCPDLGDNIRRIVAGNFAIYYQPFDDYLEIVRVIHAAWDVGKAFDE